MTLPAWMRSESFRTAIPERLPERLPGTWSLVLEAFDAAAAVVAVLIVGLPLYAVPAVCLILCAATWLVGGARISYAALPRDECYHVVAAVVAAAIPLIVMLCVFGALGFLQAILILPLLVALLCPAHVIVHAMRHGEKTAAGTADAVSPRSTRRVTSPAYRAVKRTLEGAISAIAIVASAPLMLVIAIMLLRDSDGPVVFAQERVGRDRYRFTMYKFRTMRQDSGASWVKPNDARITKTGALLRRTSLDELPQLFNVLRGEMSLVGPRPEMPEYAHDFRAVIPHYDDRTLVNPGITGWAQLHLKRNLKPADMAGVVPYDLFYVEYACFSLDLYIAIKTLAEIAFHDAV